MNELIEMMNYAKEGIIKEQMKSKGYLEGGEEDWADGNTVGIIETYEDIIRYCAERLSKNLGG